MKKLYGTLVRLMLYVVIGSAVLFMAVSLSSGIQDFVREYGFEFFFCTMLLGNFIGMYELKMPAHPTPQQFWESILFLCGWVWLTAGGMCLVFQQLWAPQLLIMSVCLAGFSLIFFLLVVAQRQASKKNIENTTSA